MEPNNIINIVKVDDKPLRKQLLKLYFDKFYPGTDGSNRWLFRGDNPGGACSDETSLKSKIDKVFEFFDVPVEKRLSREKYLFRDFCRKQYLYSNYQPESEIEKIALMRHHEGPTRLMDWTYSFLVAVYFAINSAKNYCVVWAINENWINGECDALHQKLNIPAAKPPHEDATWNNEKVLEKFWDEYFWKNCIGKDQNLGWIYPMTSFYLNKRLTLQRGIFLCQADIRIPWFENLKKMKDSDSRIYQINIQWGKDSKERDDIINMLFEMNINQATLFQDLDGLTMSLRTKLASEQCFPNT